MESEIGFLQCWTGVRGGAVRRGEGGGGRGGGGRRRREEGGGRGRGEGV